METSTTVSLMTEMADSAWFPAGSVATAEMRRGPSN